MGDPTRPVFYSRALCSATMPVTLPHLARIAFESYQHTLGQYIPAGDVDREDQSRGVVNFRGEDVTKLWRHLQSMDGHDWKACDLERMRLIDKYVGEERRGYGVDSKTLGSIMGYRETTLHALMGCDLSQELYPELYARPGY